MALRSTDITFIIIIIISNQQSIHRTYNLDFIFINGISRTDILSNLIETTFDMTSRNLTVNAPIFLGDVLIVIWFRSNNIQLLHIYTIIADNILCLVHASNDKNVGSGLWRDELAKYWVHLDIVFPQRIHQVTQQMRCMKTLSILSGVTRMVTNSGQMILMYHAENFFCLFESFIK